MGCPDCYETFDKILQPMLKNMHSGNEHCGKVPEKALARIDYSKQLNDLEDAINQAVKKNVTKMRPLFVTK